MHNRGESASMPLAHGIGAMEPQTHRAAAVAAEHEIRAAGDSRTDAYNAFGTVRQGDTAYTNNNNNNISSLSSAQYPHQHQHYGDAEYYDGVPDVPPARWAAGGTAPYSPLHTRFDEQQQTGYESYRPHRTPYDEGGYGYRG